MSVTKNQIAVAGGSGDLGQKIVTHLLARGATVRVLVRKGKRKPKDIKGTEIFEVDYNNPLSLVDACMGSSCVVSTLSGLGDVLLEAQTNLLNAALEADVKRFIPSDFCIDYRPLKPGDNRNLDLRREFSAILDKSPIKGTSILNGMFTDLLTGDAPVILFRQKRIFFWGNADQKMDFTTMENTAAFTAAAALDEKSPRWLTIAGDVASMRDIQRIASEVTGEDFKMLRPGGLRAFKALIKMTRLVAPGKKETFPSWQGMQYLYDMLSGAPKFSRLDNERYPGIQWTKIGTVLKER